MNVITIDYIAKQSYFMRFAISNQFFKDRWEYKHTNQEIKFVPQPKTHVFLILEEFDVKFVQWSDWWADECHETTG